MNDSISKLKLIYVPFLIVAVSVITLYLFLYWLILIRLQLFSLDEMITDYFGPLGIIAITVIVALGKRIKLFKFKTSRSSGLYYIVPIATIGIPTLIGINFMSAATGKLTALDNITQINSHPFTKYYSLKDFYLDKKNHFVYSTSEVSGRYNSDLNFTIYIVVPVYDDASDTSKGTVPAWLGISYSKTISNSGSDASKDMAFSEFSSESMQNFSYNNLYRFVYLEKLNRNISYDSYAEVIERNSTNTLPHPIIFKSVNEPFAARTGNTFSMALEVFAGGNVLWMLMIFFTGYNSTALNNFKAKKFSTDNTLSGFREALIPGKKIFITPLIIDANILVFLLMVFSGVSLIYPQNRDLLAWGGNYGPLISNGQWWRLLSSTFVHAGIIHIASNMVALWFAGEMLEPVIGKTKFLFIYLVTGLMASLTSMYCHPNTLSVGASGAIFGLFGALLALLLTKTFPRVIKQSFITVTLIFVGFNLISGLSTTGIDNAAHIGGLISGFISGFLIYPFINKANENNSGIVAENEHTDEQHHKEKNDLH